MSKLLHQQVLTRLRESVQKGRFTAGKPLPSERQLCRDYQVSLITIRKALQELRNEGLIYSLPGKGSFTHEAGAVTKKSTRKPYVVYLSEHITGFHETRTIGSMYRALTKSGYQLVLAQGDFNLSIHKKCVEDIDASTVAGVIYKPYLQGYGTVVNAVLRRRLPAVIYAPKVLNHSIDNLHYAYREPARLFFESAHRNNIRKIVCVFPGMGDNYVQADLWNVFEKSPLALKGKTHSQKIGPENPERDESKKLLRRNIPHLFPRELVTAHVKKHGLPEIFFCPDEYQAVGTYLALKDLGVKVPGECGIVAFTDHMYSMTHLGIRFSGFVQDQETIGTRLVETLLFRLGHPGAAPSETFIESSWQKGDTLLNHLNL